MNRLEVSAEAQEIKTKTCTECGCERPYDWFRKDINRCWKCCSLRPPKVEMMNSEKIKELRRLRQRQQATAPKKAKPVVLIVDESVYGSPYLIARVLRINPSRIYPMISKGKFIINGHRIVVATKE